MAAHRENNESKQQEWDMEFKDPFSLEEDELTTGTCCSGSRSQPAVVTNSYFWGSHFAVETVVQSDVQSAVATSSLQTVTHEYKTATTGVELPKWYEKSQRHQSDIAAGTCLSTAVSVHGSERIQHVNESVALCGTKSALDTYVELNSSEVTSSEEQSPIPVMLSSAKRFCSSDDIENSRAAEWCSAYKLPSPSATVSKSPVCFPPPAYPPTTYNIPAWPTANLPLLPSNSSVTTLAVPPMLPYNNCIPYSGGILPHSSKIPVLYNESTIPVVDGTSAPHWPGARLHLQNILSKPPPPLPDVSHVVAVCLPSSNFPGLQTGSVPQLLNGLTAHRLPLSTVPQVIPPFPPPNVNRLTFITSTHSVLQPQQCRPHNPVPRRDKSALPAVSSMSVSASKCLSSTDSVVAQQPKSSSANAHDVSVIVSSPALLKHNNITHTEHNNNKHLLQNVKTEQSTLPVTDKSTVASTGVSDCSPSLTSSESTSKQTVTSAASYSRIPPPEIKLSSTFAQLDPRIHNGLRQSSGTSAQLRSSANAASTQSTVFVVPVPPPLPSLEELTAENSEDPVKEEKISVLGLTSPSTASDTMTTDSPQLDKVISTTVCTLLLILKLIFQ